MLVVYHGSDHKVGTTLIAHTSAEWFAQKFPQKKVLYIALNKKKSCDFIKEPPPSFERFRKNQEGPKSREQLFRRYQISANLYGMSGPEQEWNESKYGPEDAADLLCFAKEYFDIIVADTGCDVNSGIAIGALKQNRINVLIFTQNEMTLTRWEAQADTYRQLGIDFNVKVINKYKNRQPPSTGYIMERTKIGSEVYISLPFAPDGYRAEWEKRSLLSYHNRSCHKQINTMMEMLLEIGYKKPA